VVVPLRAGNREQKTLETAEAAIQALASSSSRGIPPFLLHDAAGVAILPHVVKAGVVLDGEFGRGVILPREEGGKWGNPVFVTLSGGGIGGQAGIETTDLILVFKTRASLDRALKGKVKFGADVAVAVVPVGQEAEAELDPRRAKAEVFSYSHSRGLFVGLSLEGAGLRVDKRANEAFYGASGSRVADVPARREPAIAAVESMKAQLTTLSATPVPHQVVPVGPPSPIRHP